LLILQRIPPGEHDGKRGAFPAVGFVEIDGGLD